MGSKEDFGSDCDAPLVDGLDDKLIFIKAYKALRITEWAMVIIGAAIAIGCLRAGVWWPLIGYVILGSFLAMPIQTGKKALRIAVETEEERNEEREHYRRLSEELCLREFRKGSSGGRSRHS